jgi:hypothetical protein
MPELKDILIWLGIFLAGFYSGMAVLACAAASRSPEVKP